MCVCVCFSIYMKLLSSGRPVPTARIAVCGGFIMAENSLIPNIPRFDILDVVNFQINIRLHWNISSPIINSSFLYSYVNDPP